MSTEERTQVYAIEQDKESEGVVTHEDKVINEIQQNENDLPNIIQKLLKWQFSRNKLLCNIAFLPFWFEFFVVYSIVFNSPYIGIAIMGPLLPIMLAFYNSIPDYGEGIYQSILHENPKILKGIVKKMSMIFLSVVPIMALSFVSCRFSTKFKYSSYGKHTDLIYYIFLGAFPITMIGFVEHPFYSFNVSIHSQSME